MSQLRKVALAALAVLALLAGPAAASAMADGGGRGALYTQTNDPAGNTVQAFERAGDGSLTPAGTYATGGAGLAGLGGRQGAVELSDDEETVYAINAGSNTVTAFRVVGGGDDDDEDDDDRRSDGPALELAGIVASGGVAPVSVDAHRDRVYVLNSGGMPNVTAFAVGRRGTLTPIGSRELPGALGAAQVSVTPDGSRLVVSERLSHRLETLALDRWGRPGAPVVTASSGMVPFGFAFGRRGEVIVSEAGASTVSSYGVDRGGALRTITPSLAVNQGAACWLAAAPNGRFAYTGNASGSISGFAVDRDGALTALNADGLTAPLIPSPRDLDFSANGRFLYAVSPGNATTGGLVTGYRVGSDGSLTQITSAPAAPGITGAAAA